MHFLFLDNGVFKQLARRQLIYHRKSNTFNQHKYKITLPNLHYDTFNELVLVMSQRKKKHSYLDSTKLFTFLFHFVPGNVQQQQNFPCSCVNNGEAIFSLLELITNISMNTFAL